jgi:hypothetical protein
MGKQFPQNKRSKPMNKDNIISNKIKQQMQIFSNNISRDFSKTRKRFISQMIFGIQASRDIKLSNVSRSLDEEIKLIKTENRLSRNMQTLDLTDKINIKLTQDAASRITRDTVLALDLSDINKPFAKKMDYLAGVWNGSEGKVGNGYWIVEVTAAHVNKEEIIPLYSELYSHEKEGFESENKQILKAINTVNSKTKGKGIWVLDRGGDRYVLVEELDKLGLKFIIRTSGKRNITIDSGEEKRIISLASNLPCNECYSVTVDKEGYTENIELSLGQQNNIKLRGIDISIVVVRGFGEEPMILFTNVCKTSHEILEMYLTRWKCEESFRFLKQEYKLEDVRVRRYISLRNTVVLLHCVFYFLSVYLSKRLKMNILLKKILEKAKRFFQVPVFKQYAIADGIYRLLFNTSWEEKPKKPIFDTGQLEFRFI